VPDPVGIESVGGAADKILPMVQFPVVMRLVLPGALAVAVLSPFIRLPDNPVGAHLEDIWRPVVLLLLRVLVLGGLVALLSDEIYKVYEGRVWWPQWLFDFCTNWQQSRVRRLLELDQRAKITKNSVRRAEIWYRLRRFPVDNEGKRYASHPTLLGNILAEYESYPKTRYGMDSVFFWYRIWFVMENERKKEVDASWSIADGLLALSAVSVGGSLLWFVAGIFRSVSIVLLPFRSSITPRVGGGLLLLLGFIFYRLSLPYHRANGEIFKTIFDLYRDRIGSMTRLGTIESMKWEGTWSYLQYLKVSCMSCKKHYSIAEDPCPFCKCPRDLSLRELERQSREE
jgi:hypothetical protein